MMRSRMGTVLATANIPAPVLSQERSVGCWCWLSRPPRGAGDRALDQILPPPDLRTPLGEEREVPPLCRGQLLTQLAVFFLEMGVLGFQHTVVPTQLCSVLPMRARFINSTAQLRVEIPDP